MRIRTGLGLSNSNLVKIFINEWQFFIAFIKELDEACKSSGKTVWYCFLSRSHAHMSQLMLSKIKSGTRIRFMNEIFGLFGEFLGWILDSSSWNLSELLNRHQGIESFIIAEEDLLSDLHWIFVVELNLCIETRPLN